MSFLDIIDRAKAHLERHRRVSLRALRREFALDDAAIAELVDELVAVQQVAVLDGTTLTWGSGTDSPTAAPEPVPPEEVATPSAVPEAERRHLTVMFCDLVGSTALSEQLDPEDTRTIIRAYQEVAAAAIGRFGGHLAKYIGDGVLAYFGYPEAHDDDAQRSVRTALEIRERLPGLNEQLQSVLAHTREQRINTRTGIHTGLVVAGEMGTHARPEEMAIVGDTPNIAARLEGVAEPGAIVISDDTLRLVPGLFVTKDLGTPTLKGIGKPMRAHAVLRPTGVSSRFEAHLTRLTPLVGRDREIARLLDRWSQSKKGDGQVVLISGGPGLGKSRLLHAFRERLTGEPHTWLECACSPHAQERAFYPFTELFARSLGFKQQDALESKIALLERGLEFTGLSAAEAMPLIAPLMALPLPDRYSPLQYGPELRRKKTIETLVAWLLALSQQQALVTVVEDLHWCDPSTMDLLGLVIERIPSSRMLTLLSFRPHFEPPWAMGMHLTSVSVNQLGDREAAHMVSSIAGEASLPAKVVNRIVERTDGVPLFLEELTKMVLDSGVVQERAGRYELTGELNDLPIPATLQGSLMARLDRLVPGKETAQLGAALGRDFSYELLCAVSPLGDPTLREALAQLADAEILYRRGAPPRATYTFKHAMVQDIAYESMLKSTRRKVHARIANVLEDQFPELVASEPALVASHFDRADRAELAIARYQRASTYAVEHRASYQEAAGYLRRAIELQATLPNSVENDRHEFALQMDMGATLGALHGWAHPRCEGAYKRAHELRVRGEGVSGLPEVLAARMRCRLNAGDARMAAELGMQCLGAAERTGNNLDLLTGHYAVGLPRLFQGNPSGAVRHLERAIELYDTRMDPPLTHAFEANRGVVFLSYAALCYSMLGYSERAKSMSQRAISLAKEIDHSLSLAHALSWAATVYQLRREREETRMIAEETADLCERLGFPNYFGLGKALHGWAQADSEQGEQAVAELQQGLAELARIGTGFAAPYMLAVLSDALWTIGRHEDGLGALALAVAMAEDKGQHFMDAELRRLRADILMDRDPSVMEEAETLLQEALVIARRQEAKLFELRSTTSLARLWERQGKDGEARARLAEIYHWFTEGFDTQDLKDAKALLDELA